MHVPIHRIKEYKFNLKMLSQLFYNPHKPTTVWHNMLTLLKLGELIALTSNVEDADLSKHAASSQRSKYSVSILSNHGETSALDDV